jgi:hypothetical protein
MSSNLWLNVIGGSAAAGTYAGFNNIPGQVAAQRNGADGAVFLGLDGDSEQGMNVFFDMPDNVVLDIGGSTPDDQLPLTLISGQHPYASLTGPPNPNP